MNIKDIDIKEVGITFVSAEVVSGLKSYDVIGTDILIENGVYAFAYTWLRKKYPQADDGSIKYYALVIAQSIVAEGLGELVAMVVEGDKKPKLKAVVLEGILKYFAVMVGDLVFGSLMGDPVLNKL